jgi:hypothetical protein
MLGQLVNWDYQWGQIVGRAWADDEFKQRLLAETTAVLEEYDLAPPAGVRVELLQDAEWVPESTDDVLYLAMPARPSDEELSEDELCSIGGPETAKRCGGCGGCGGCHRCHHCYCDWCGGCHHPPRPDDQI